MKPKVIIAIIIVLLVAGGIYFLVSKGMIGKPAGFGGMGLNPMENFPSANPFEKIWLNPFEKIKINPFK